MRLAGNPFSIQLRLFAPQQWIKCETGYLFVSIQASNWRVYREAPGWSPCQPEFALILALWEQLCLTKQRPSRVPEANSANSRASSCGPREGRRRSGIEMAGDGARVWREKSVRVEGGGEEAMDVISCLGKVLVHSATPHTGGGGPPWNDAP